MEQKDNPNKITITITIPKALLSLVNFWPAILVGLTLLFALPNTAPILKELPERLIMTEADAAQAKPALPEPDTELPQEAAPIAGSGRTYTDGIYKGSSRGYGGTITVQVTVAETKISKVDILRASGETSSYLNRAKKVIDAVIAAQTWEVDAVSGATYSSRGILGAIQNALTGEKVENEKPVSSASPAAPLKKEEFDDTAPWKDGVYTGSATGFGGTIRVEVTVTGGKIAAIRVLDHSSETSSYYNKAKEVIKRILSKGTPNVDTISGATYSSNGIINAVKDALRKAAGGEGENEEGGQTPDTPETPADPGEDETDDPEPQDGYNDGIYSMEAVCTDDPEDPVFDYTVRTTIVLKDNEIKYIEAERTQDRSQNPEANETYFGYAVNGRTKKDVTYQSVIDQILKKQTTKGIDSVSGATFSSKTIIQSVRALLKQAARNPSGEDEDEEGGDEGGSQETPPGGEGEDDGSGDGESKDDSGDGKEDGGSGDDGGDDEGGQGQDAASWKDGTYKNDVVCRDDDEDPVFDYTLRITTVIEDGKIASISVERTEDRSEQPDDNAGYIQRAKEGRTWKGVVYRGIPEQILSAQSTSGIDTVSGATWSSKAILKGVRSALEEASREAADDAGTGTTDDAGTGTTDGSGTGATDDAGTGTTDGSGTGANDDAGTGATDDAGTGTTDDAGTGTTDDAGKGTTDGSGTGATDDAGTGAADSSGTEASDDDETDDGGKGATRGTGKNNTAETGATDDAGTGAADSSGTEASDDAGTDATDDGVDRSADQGWKGERP